MANDHGMRFINFQRKTWNLSISGFSRVQLRFELGTRFKPTSARNFFHLMHLLCQYLLDCMYNPALIESKVFLMAFHDLAAKNPISIFPSLTLTREILCHFFSTLNQLTPFLQRTDFTHCNQLRDHISKCRSLWKSTPAHLSRGIRHKLAQQLVLASASHNGNGVKAPACGKKFPTWHIWVWTGWSTTGPKCSHKI